MNLVKFPGLGIEFNISKYVMKLGNIYIYKYALLIVLAIVIGLFLSKKSKENFGIKFDFIIDSMIGAIIFGIVGARIYYVIFNLKEYISNPLEILNIRDGGLAIYGGIIAIAIYLYIKCRKKKVDFFDFCDYMIPYLALRTINRKVGQFL